MGVKTQILFVLLKLHISHFRRESYQERTGQCLAMLFKYWHLEIRTQLFHTEIKWRLRNWNQYNLKRYLSSLLHLHFGKKNTAVTHFVDNSRYEHLWPEVCLRNMMMVKSEAPM